jgi:hypothetical protein
MPILDAVGRLRRPEYTGENRCTPCTIVNVGLTGLFAGAVALLHPVAGVAALVGSLALVYVRGYLVPGTPELTQRFLPEWVLARFGKASVEPTASADPADREGWIDVLSAGGVLTGEGSDRRLDPAFRDDWRARLAERADSDVDSESDAGDVAALFDAEEASAQSDRSFVVDGEALVRWESRVALVADLAAGAALRARLDGWERVDRDERRDVLTALRLFLDACPDCGGRVATDVLTADPCCQPAHTTFDAACEDCGATVAVESIVGTDADAADRPPGYRFLST